MYIFQAGILRLIRGGGGIIANVPGGIMPIGYPVWRRPFRILPFGGGSLLAVRWRRPFEDGRLEAFCAFLLFQQLTVCSSDC